MYFGLMSLNLSCMLPPTASLCDAEKVKGWSLHKRLSLKHGGGGAGVGVLC